MGSIEFQIEGTSRARHNRLLVFARLLKPAHFTLTPTSTLLGSRIEHVSQPRIVQPDGTPRLDVFAFEIAPSTEVAIGAVVVLANVDVMGG